MNAGHDENGRPTIICVSDQDGKTVVPLLVSDSTHFLNVSIGNTGSDKGNNSGNARTDDNGISSWTALSSAGDGSIVEIYADSNSNILMAN